ncbi:MAG: hypothetical protein A3C93_02070 [Candidatus Lloydbacteria bacterium RIFCSPHIGHO2_02_FULL_54_17]|uniref:Uncharacterized protein n=1 Tax=Candidatus Lloydbacteria bacterium RIFCSPHIGHO2_02_FULL_54_17 TaxID=1798664 RepID=A0A1G2DK97_9BACT|nr:MAG: hypothetical protein A2762_05620 [Candidatus Lloydbacteria bacterium RIFCSPHIGHO2_01_FULL_54_11]OGZ13238.1 MAG: hypothetical protein A3C93_02070 [Candidatus Lloydbacteria bacterium RIFCSPHIGHO2_02_FULL_54_17]OGZ14896.1 MAG: hypothetical protein A3H76_02680 [Candidatus Lloydbacteria bacterium RIFCSPLOWO2_02_FULL_54_12]OGZ15368.1 MAG: hypothetical protein A2948_00085 [Candidatus Lloydbacteria bacterium RIFCSPLOWO2_01_FULL_54_18]
MKQVLTILFALVVTVLGIFVAFGIIPVDALSSAGGAKAEMLGAVIMLCIAFGSCSLIILVNKTIK